MSHVWSTIPIFVFQIRLAASRRLACDWLHSNEIEPFSTEDLQCSLLNISFER